LGIDDKIFEKEKIIKLLFKFAIPAIISLLVSELYNMVDTVFVGRYVGPNAIAALTVVFPIQRFLTSIGMLIAVGTSTYVSRSLGKKDLIEIRKIIVSAFIITLTFIIATSSFIFIIKKPLLYKLGASSLSFYPANEYIKIILFGSIFQCLSLVLCNIMTSLGNANMTIYATSIGAILNIILDYILVVNMGIGVKGAAIATVISQIISCIFVFYKFRKVINNFKIKFSIKCIKEALDKNLIQGIIAIGFSTFIVEISDAIVAVILNNLLYSTGGDSAIIIVGIVTKVSMFMFIAIIGISSAMQPIAAYNFGAKKFNKVKKTVSLSIEIVTITSLVFFIIINLFATKIIGFFLQDKEILYSTVKALRICIFLLPLTGVYYIAIYYYQAIKEAQKSFLLSIFRQLIAFIPLAIIFVELLGTIGVWIAYPVSDAISTILSIYLLRKSPKKEVKINVNTITNKTILLNKIS